MYKGCIDGVAIRSEEFAGLNGVETESICDEKPRVLCKELMKGENKGDTRKANRKEDIVVLWKKVKTVREFKVPYMIIHLPSFFSFVLVGMDPPASILVCRNARTRFMNRRSTFCAVLAEVSMNSQPKCRAIAAPSSFDTSRS